MPRKGQKHSLETRAKMSAAKRGNKNSLGHKLSPESRAKISAALRGNKNCLGHRHTPEARAKMSAAQRGRVVSPATRAKMSASASGKVISPEQRVKISASMSGKVFSPEHRARIGAAQHGSNNPNWRGGISREPYTWEWNAELREEVRRRDGHKCQLCGAPQAECKRKLSVHHVDYDKTNSDPVNLVALCHSCHSRTVANREHWMAMFQQMMVERQLAGDL